MSRICQYLQHRRIEKGLSKNQLSIKSGLSRATIIKVENGTNQPSIETLRALSKPLETPLMRLMIVAGMISKEEVLEYMNYLRGLKTHATAEP